MLGPLPRLHRWVVLGVVIGASVGLGLWATRVVPALPAPLGLAGGGAGALVGAVVAFALLHQAHPRGARLTGRRDRLGH